MSASISLKGKVAIVTGGGRGIGKAITKRLVEAGAAVAIGSRKLENLEATAKEFSGLPGKVVPIECHVGRNDQLENLVRQTEARLGPVDILVNNSATNIGQGPSLDVTDEMLDKMIEVNVKSALRLVRLTVPKMIERKTGGSVINIVSIAGLQPQPGGLLYSFTKAGLIMMTRSWAREFGPGGVRANAIAPGVIQTDFSEYFWKNEQRRALIQKTQPIPRIGQPDEVGFAALYLASDEASFVTGQVFVGDGGAPAYSPSSPRRAKVVIFFASRSAERGPAGSYQRGSHKIIPNRAKVAAVGSRSPSCPFSFRATTVSRKKSKYARLRLRISRRSFGPSPASSSMRIDPAPIPPARRRTWRAL